jgi:hypothetical protein
VLSFYVSIAIALVVWFDGSQASAEPPLAGPATTTTWAVRVAPHGRCSVNEGLEAVLASQIPVAQRAPVDQAELVAEVSIEDGGVARIRVFDRVLNAEAGARELQLSSRSCDESAEAVALVLAVLVEAGRGALSAAPITPLTPPPPTPPPPPSPPPPRRVEPPPPPTRHVVRHAWLGPRAGHDLNLAVGVGVGLLPAPTLGATAGWGIRGTKAWPVWLEVTGFRSGATRDVPAELRILYGSLLGCPLHKSWRLLRTRACAGAGFGAVWGEGRAMAQSFKDANPVALVGLELAGSLRLVGPLELTLLGRGDASLFRTVDYYRAANGAQVVFWRPPVVSGSLFAGLALRFR